ncbi:MAG: cob(I)alamin adenosyltransferase [Thermotogaceae bacterium]|jgi:cob(I)alamin adenosyltransferase|nr:cob(I)alamin adenosyltransferase [Thermotogaceae bacterium]MDN5337965.1 cob(I)alamin adenosyltransferase [Thermotogaceae bacterium]
MSTNNSKNPQKSKFSSDDNSLGLIQVYTGDGKGKTTAALGLALRAYLHGFKVAFIQFMKGTNYGEDRISKLLPGFHLEKFGRKEFVNPESPDPRDIDEAKKALYRCKELAFSGEFDLLVMDEINVAMTFKLISVEEVLDFLKSKPSNLEIVLTGRYAPKEIIEIADLVSEIKEIKHPYIKGIPARRGIEY